jgi:hypothetical protein
MLFWETPRRAVGVVAMSLEDGNFAGYEEMQRWPQKRSYLTCVIDSAGYSASAELVRFRWIVGLTARVTCVYMPTITIRLAPDRPLGAGTESDPKASSGFSPRKLT